MFQKKLFYIILFFTLILTISITSCISIQKSLSKKVLRLHILANSNSSFDQELKLKVRDEVVKYLTPLLKNSSNLSETKEIISNNLSSINDVAQSVVSNFSNYKTTCSLATSSFPTKQYENISFPAGKYEALKISIGNGEGNNWWCVMFPPLCFTNSSAGKFDDSSKEQLKENLSEEEYYVVNNYNKSDVKIKFKILEWLNP